jgi:hypothetical protein
MADRRGEFRPVQLHRSDPLHFRCFGCALHLGGQPALHRLSGRQRLFGRPDRAALVLDSRHRSGHAARTLARRQAAGPAVRCLFSVSGRFRTVDQRDDHARIDPCRGPARRHLRSAVRHRGLALALARADDHAASGPDADHSGVRLPGAGAVPVRVRPDGGRHCHADLRDPADDPHRHSVLARGALAKSSIWATWSAAPNGR